MSDDEVSFAELDAILKKTKKAKKAPETIQPRKPKKVPPSTPAPTFLDMEEHKLKDEDEVVSTVETVGVVEQVDVPEEVAEVAEVAEVTVKPKKTNKKAIDKIVADVKKQNPQKVVEVADEPSPDIEYVLKTHTKYDLNWYYVKEKFVRLKRWIFSPWRMYVNWWNKKFNKAVVKEDDLWETIEKNSDVGGNKIIADEIKRNVDKRILEKRNNK